jgi:OFA family oxalate/formate antiporter-like MFS transporter
MGGIYGINLLAWGLAAVPSPFMIGCIHQNLGKYGPAINVITIVVLCSLILPLIARPTKERAPAQVSPILAHR